MTQTPDDLGFNINAVSTWFQREQSSPYMLIRIKEDDVAEWEDVLCAIFRRCYVTDKTLLDKIELGVPITDLLSAKLPDAGSTMSGDFGEILAYLFQSCDAKPSLAVGPKKWRLKQDRTKPAPYSDVVHFVLPDWPHSGTNDQLLCAEVKTKATRSPFKPVEAAIQGCEKDRTSRLAATLAWLRDKALYEDLGGVGIDEIDRFLKPDKHPTYKKDHRAIAVICSSLLNDELGNAPTVESENYAVVIISVPELRKTYTSIYQAVANSSVVNQGAEY
jgi:hypothetical protein